MSLGRAQDFSFWRGGVGMRNKQAMSITVPGCSYRTGVTDHADLHLFGRGTAPCTRS